MANIEVPMTCIGVPVDQLVAEIVQSMIKLIEADTFDPSSNKMLPELQKRSSPKSENFFLE